MSQTTKIPFLQSVTWSDHISYVLRTLGSRERRRSVARHVCLMQELEKSQVEKDGRLQEIIADSMGRKGITQEQVTHYSIANGLHDDTKGMNRYTDIIPYDRTRVQVGKPGAGEGRTHPPRYLNANWVLERYGHKWWIAAQAPLNSTAHAFMSLMLTPVLPPRTSSSTQSSKKPPIRIRTVVQLTQNVERGMKKADPYFPSEVGQHLIVPPEAGCLDPPLQVTLLATRFHKDEHCIQSTVSIVPISNGATDVSSPTEQATVFNHMLYLSWPDHGVPEPEDRESLLKFLRLVDQVNRVPVTPSSPLSDPDPPIMVNCSAGIGRTGSFLAISSLLRNYGFLPPAAHPSNIPPTDASPLGPIPSDLEDDLILQEIDSLREQRPGMVQRTEQVLLVYELLGTAFAAAQS
ncbi:hypothetical protein D9613_004118 [Agrocybe pediades]|uniref:Phosphatases II n=1 Tax=Agrocybe pediades TaxID=84607 RepID=A0A8H4QJT5_9AGAR|nr:hypothetical protein D9613_004118 [Agrocybe pediades]KAF9566901.1 phosphatases II [Agrocybe pediades]